MKVLDTLQCIMVSGSEMKENTKFYRIRKLQSDLRNMPTTKQEIWYPPKECVIADGRTNFRGSPILYCSFDQTTPLFECNVKPGEYYALIRYTVKPTMKLIAYQVVNDFAGQNLNERGKTNHKIINDFLQSEFTKPVGKGTEYLYKISNIICQNFLDLPNCDAYIYPSVARYKKGWNISIKPKSVDEKLEFDGVRICRLISFEPDNDYVFEVIHLADKVDEQDKLIYFA